MDFFVMHRLEEDYGGEVALFEAKNPKRGSINSLQLLEKLINTAIYSPNKWVSHIDLIESKKDINVLQYKRNKDRYVDFELSDLSRMLRHKDGFISNIYGQVSYSLDKNNLSLFFGEALTTEQIGRLDATRLATVMFLMPEELIDFAISQLILKVSATTNSIYSDSKNTIRISDHWNVSTGTLLTEDSIIPPVGCWAVGELVHQNTQQGRFYRITETSTKSVHRNNTQRLAIIKRLQEKVFVGKPKQLQQLADLAAEFSNN